MLMYAFYYYWRSTGNSREGASFVLYILAAVIYNVYACIWVGAASAFPSGPNSNPTQDYLTDWSFLRIHAEHPLLRDEVLYPDYLPVSRYPKDLYEATPNNFEAAVLFRYRMLSLYLILDTM
jgi:hypothetical protein